MSSSRFPWLTALALVLVGLGVWLNEPPAAGGPALTPEVAVPEGGPVERQAAGDFVAVETPKAPEAVVEEASARELVAVPDPESARANLTLELVDAETGLGVHDPVILWRLDLPETKEWTAGDERVNGKRVESPELRFEDLPIGRYRVVPWELAIGAESPPAFDIGPGENRVRLEIETAGRRQVSLALVDRSGKPLQGELRFYKERSQAGFNAHHTPDWANERSRKDVILGGAAGGGRRIASSSHRSWRARRKGPDGYELGALYSSSVVMKYQHLWKLRVFSGEAPATGATPEGRHYEVKLVVPDATADAYLAVAVDPRDIARALEGVNDLPLDVCEGALSLTLRAARKDEPEDVVVEIAFEHDDRRLDVTWRPLAEDLPPLVVPMANPR